jgi:glutathione synthase/RimK-type ligase-like ATP-grasp enzyme
MTKKILILAAKRSENKEKLITYLQKYFDKKAEVVLAIFSDLIFEIEEGKVLVEINGRNINDFNLIYFRNTSGFQAMAAALSIYLESTNVKFFDKSHISGSFMGDKFTSLMRLAVNNLPIVQSVLCWKKAIPKNKELIVQKLGFPIVAKEVTTQRMQSIFLLKNLTDFDNLPDKTKNGRDARFLFQKFISIDKEFRVLVLGNTVGIVHTKTVRDNTGFKLGYKNENEYPEFLDPKDVPNIIKDTAIKSANVLKIQIAGVDICREVGNNKIYVFEVNRGPGIDYDTKVSQELQKIGDFFASELDIK